jgi:hypothetical protein
MMLVLVWESVMLEYVGQWVREHLLKLWILGYFLLSLKITISINHRKIKTRKIAQEEITAFHHIIHVLCPLLY